MMLNKKRGQFYLIAAVIIIVVLFGLVAITNKVITKPREVNTYQLSKELNLEGESVINYGILKEEDLKILLKDFTEEYGPYIGEDTNVYFIYGNEDGLKATIYQKVDAGSVSLGGSTITISARNIVFQDYPPIEPGAPISIKINEKEYKFDLNEGQNFFFVLKEPKTLEVENEKTESEKVENAQQKSS
ncbi:hypothetical protein HYW74_03955 [Candidatus Pacearchaeota archaeon]|nr:hypothetical protein [Candidatus Pacearchaeota archaeon]